MENEKAFAPRSLPAGAVGVLAALSECNEPMERRIAETDANEAKNLALPHSLSQLRWLENEIESKQRVVCASNTSSSLPGAFDSLPSGEASSESEEMRVRHGNVGRASESLRSLQGQVTAKSAAQESCVRLQSANEKPHQLTCLRNLNEQVATKSLPDGTLPIQGDAKLPVVRALQSLRSLNSQVAIKTSTGQVRVQGVGALQSLRSLHDQVSANCTNGRRLRIQEAVSTSSSLRNHVDPVFGVGNARHIDPSVPDGDMILQSEKRGSDVEYGLHGQQPRFGDNQDGLVTAIAVQEDDGGNFVPSAVEYDPDLKPSVYRNRRFRLYIGLVVLIATAGIVGTVTGLLLSMLSSTDVVPPALSDRAILGIRETIAPFVVGTDVDQQLDTVTSPYRKALDWIQDVDSMSLTVDGNNLIQRYLMAYFYYSTSIHKPWTSDCGTYVAGESEVCENVIIPLDRSWTSRTVASIRWLSPVHECQWAGIICDTIGQVVGIEIASANMTGSFPGGILGLPFLRSLSMAQGELTGPLPSFTHNKHMSTIVLRDNQFDGSLPANWYHSRMLHYVDLTLNRLVGSVPATIDRLKDIRELRLSENLLSGSIPSEIGYLASLAELRLDNNQLRGSLPTTLGTLHHMHQLWLHRNLLSGVIPKEIGTSSDLVDLRLHANQLNGSIPESLFSIPLMNQLDLFDNQFSGTISTKIGNWIELFRLRIENNNFGGTLPTEMGMLKQMMSFAASGNSLVGSVPRKLCALLDREDNPKSIKVLTEIQVDCLIVPPDSTAEISCPFDCCTLCCDPNGANCQVVQS